jgi:uncharacterized membrane protein (DUF441 family)
MRYGRASHSSSDGEAKPLILILGIVLVAWLLKNGQPLTTESPLIFYLIGVLTVWAAVAAQKGLRSMLGGVIVGFLIYGSLMYLLIGIIWQ